MKGIPYHKIVEVVLAAMPDDVRVVVLLPIFFLVMCVMWWKWGDPQFTSDVRPDWGSIIVRNVLRFICWIILVLFAVYVGIAIVLPIVREVGVPGPAPASDQGQDVSYHQIGE